MGDLLFYTIFFAIWLTLLIIDENRCKNKKKVTKIQRISIENAVYNHLYNMMVTIFAKERRPITYDLEKAMDETARQDLQEMLNNGSLTAYYERLKAGSL